MWTTNYHLAWKNRFISEKTSDGFPRRKDVWLTDRGKAVAKSLADLIEFLSKNP
jgi:hypothetical protein